MVDVFISFSVRNWVRSTHSPRIRG